MAANIFKTTGIQLPNQITDAPLTTAHNAQHVQFHISILDILPEARATMFGIAELMAFYKGLYDQEDVAFKQTQMYESTKQIKQLDAARDNVYRLLRDTVKTNLRALEADKRQAAEHLTYVFKPYTKTETAPYDEETALLTNLVQDCQKSANTSSVTKLGLTATVTKLKEANDLFNEVYSYRIDSKVARDAMDNMKTMRPQVDEAYRAVVQIINARHTTNELATTPDPQLSSTLTMTINAINGQIIQLRENITAVSRKSAEKAEKGE